jgi:hypothetical protein
MRSCVLRFPTQPVQRLGTPPARPRVCSATVTVTSGEQKHEAESTFAAQSKCPRHGLMSARSSGQLQDLYGLLKILKKKLEQE